MSSSNSTSLISISERPIGDAVVQTVNARELHRFLASKQDFSTWLKARFAQYGFCKDVDYLLHRVVEQLPSGAKTKTECYLTIDTAKEFSMVERTERGREARKYFIDCERKVLASQPTVKSLTPAEALHQITGLMVEQERRISITEEKVARIEAKQAAFEEGANFFTIIGYVIWKGLPAVSATEAATLGKKATKLSKARGVLVDRVRDPRFGMVGTYHADILEAVFAELWSGL